MERIRQIDSHLSQIFHGFDGIAHSLRFEMLGDLLTADLAKIQFRGLYLIEVCSTAQGMTSIDDWMAYFRTAWDQGDFKRSYVPSYQKARMLKHTALNDWMPLYLGKSEKIGKRVHEHMHLAKEKRTFALKLHARNLLNTNAFRLSILPLTVNNYDVIAPRLEAAVRRKLHPLIGRQ
jgi:hypothetical protein